jgi:hypothetical protein
VRMRPAAHPFGFRVRGFQAGKNACWRRVLIKSRSRIHAVNAFWGRDLRRFLSGIRWRGFLRTPGLPRGT